MKTVLVFGATGKTGRQVVSQALSRGWRVRAFVRDAAKLALSHERLEIAVGDMGDRASIDRALAAPVDAVVSALGVYSKEPTTVLSDGTRHIVAAMRAAGPRRIVVVSSLGAGDSSGQGSFMVRMIQRFILKQVLIDKTRQEQVLAESGLEWTSLRPPQLTDADRVRDDLVSWSGPTQPRQRLTWKVSRASVARYALEAIERQQWIGKAVCLSEPG